MDNFSKTRRRARAKTKAANGDIGASRQAASNSIWSGKIHGRQTPWAKNARKPKPGRGQGLREAKARLHEHKLFRQLDPTALNQLAGFAKKRNFKRGAAIFSKGDPGNSLYFVVEGTVKIGVSSADGRGAVFNLINPNEIFGEIALLDGLERTADALANTDCALLVIDRRDFMPFLKQQPALASSLIEMLCERIRWISDHVEQVIFPELSGRLAKALIRMMDKQEFADHPKIEITQQEIGEMVGMSRESVNKQLQDWAEQKMVRVQRGSIILLDLDALKSLAERNPS